MIVQTLTLALEAFEAELRIENSESEDLMAVEVEFEIVYTETGADASDLFVILDPSLEGFVGPSSGISQLGGIGSDSTGTILSSSTRQ